MGFDEATANRALTKTGRAPISQNVNKYVKYHDITPNLQTQTIPSPPHRLSGSLSAPVVKLAGVSMSAKADGSRALGASKS